MIEENDYWIDMAPATEDELNVALEIFEKTCKDWHKAIQNGTEYDTQITLSLRTCAILIETISEEDEVTH